MKCSHAEDVGAGMIDYWDLLEEQHEHDVVLVYHAEEKENKENESGHGVGECDSDYCCIIND